MGRLVLSSQELLCQLGDIPMSEKDLSTSISNQLQDVHKDGIKNYLDDYIYTANYLFVMKSLQTSVKNNE
jgi:hypothetical protein